MHLEVNESDKVYNEDVEPSTTFYLRDKSNKELIAGVTGMYNKYDGVDYIYWIEE